MSAIESQGDIPILVELRSIKEKQFEFLNEKNNWRKEEQ